MSIGVWEPGKSDQPEVQEISEDELKSLLSLLEEDDLSQLENLLGDKTQAFAHLMKQEEAAWAVAEKLPDEALVILVRFFTLAEMQLSGWDAGKTSPVIYLVKTLKARDAFPADLRKWIKANTDNRYLPYGSAL